MKFSAKRTLSAMLALLMIVLAIPVMGIMSFAEGSAPSGVIREADFDGLSGHTGLANWTLNDKTSYFNDQLMLGRRPDGSLGNSMATLFLGDGFETEYDYLPESVTATISFTCTPAGFPFDLKLGSHNDDGVGSRMTTLFSIDTAAQKAYFYRTIEGAFDYVGENDYYAYNIGDTLSVALKITFVNPTDDNELGSTIMEGYINGVYMGTGTVNGYDNTEMVSVYAGDRSAPRHLQFARLGDNYTGATAIDNFRVYVDAPDESYGDSQVLPSVSALEGASIRIGDTANESGLRFSYSVDKAMFDMLVASGAEVSVGAMIMPMDWAEAAEMEAFTHADVAAAGLTIVDKTITGFSDESDENNYCFNISLVKILEQNYARTFVSVGYLKVGDRYYYSEVSASSVFEVAVMYAEDESFAELSAEKQAIVNAYKNSAVYLFASEGTVMDILSMLGYTTPYTVSYAGTTLTVTGEGVGNIKAIVINGVVYRTGWTVDGTTLTATYTAPSAQ